MKRNNKIAFDLSFMKKTTSTGVGNYSLRILSYIVSHGLQDSYILLLNVHTAEHYQSLYPQFESLIVGKHWYYKIPYLHYFLWMWDFRRMANKSRARLIFCPYGNPINCWKTKAPKISVLHDMQVRMDKAKEHPKHARMYVYAEDRLVKYSKYVFTISEFARKQILGYYPEAEEKLLNMSNLVSVPVSCNLTPMQPGYQYLLFVGRLCKMKNVMTLIKAFNILKNRYTQLKVVLLSNTADYWNSTILPFAQSHGIKEHVVFVQSCSDEDLIRWYKGASLFVFPSLREGFGFPPIEAGMLGVPVVSSKADSLEEVTLGLLNYYEPPTDENQLAVAIANALDKPQSAEELENIKEQYQNHYSIDKVAGRICEFLHQQ